MCHLYQFLETLCPSVHSFAMSTRCFIILKVLNSGYKYYLTFLIKFQTKCHCLKDKEVSYVSNDVKTKIFRQFLVVILADVIVSSYDELHMWLSWGELTSHID